MDTEERIVKLLLYADDTTHHSLVVNESGREKTLPWLTALFPQHASMRRATTLPAMVLCFSENLHDKQLGEGIWYRQRSAAGARAERVLLNFEYHIFEFQNKKTKTRGSISAARTQK